MTILQNHYVLAVRDLAGSAAFFVDVLGFQVVDEPPGWIFVAKDACMLMLGECPGAMPPAKLGDHSYFGYLRVDDADTYYQRLKRKGATISSPIEDKPWQMREFGVRTPEGHRLMIGEYIGG